MAQVHEMLFMKMSNGEYIYGSNLDIGRYSVKFEPALECVHEFDHVPPMKLEGQGGYSDGSKAFKYVGTDHDPMTVSHPPSQEMMRVTARGEKEFYQTNGWDYKTGEYIYNEKW
tara:strand:+ start:321 stop:662 length:342 start_codon:yes stop_codon:yes gene_type:complete